MEGGNLYSGNGTVITFEGLFSNRELKSICITFAVIFVPINLLLLYSIIWYEHFGVDAKQTIINKFLSSACWTCIIFILFVQVPELGRYLIGPMSETICTIQFTMKNVTSVQVLLFFDCIVVARYVYIFHLRNPAAFQDDFWNR